MKIWIKRLAWMLALPLALLLGLALWVGFKVLGYEQIDNQTHLAEKADYLEQLPKVAASQQRPNIVFILFDDMGYGDLGSTGSRAIKTPVLDELAAGGVSLSNFYSPAPTCTPARAAYLTGRYPLRAGLPSVVFPTGSPINLMHITRGINIRLPAEEITLADVLGASGYATGMVGKWHMGDRSPSLPNDMGFDSYFGALYSNDMKPFALYRDREIEIEAPADQTRLNEWYANEAVNFIERHSGEAFFLYYAHNFPHIPLHAAAAQQGQSEAGLYGDVVEGLDWGVAQIVAALKAQGVYDNTLIIVTSDNGPWYQGSPGNNRGRKGDTFEGGMHVPFIAHWPDGFEGGRSLDGISMGIDLFPTVLDWLDLPLPSDRLIDGKSIRNMLERGAGSPHDYLYYFFDISLMAVRDERFKYHDARSIVYTQAGQPLAAGPTRGPWLFDMQIDDNESYDLSMTRTADAERMAEVFAAKQREMEENRRGWIE